jgi:hypothetical protein
MKRIGSENKKNIYIAIPEIELLQQRKYADIDQSVVDFVKKYDKGTLVKLR